MNPVFQLFLNARVNGIMQGLQDPRLLPQPMIWNDRIPDVPADESEIMARFNGTMMIADLIADDAKAGIYSMGAFSFYSGSVPNLKIGVGMNQAMINVLGRLKQFYDNPNDLGVFSDWQGRAILNALYAVQLRKETLKLAMVMDDFSYDRLGIKMTGVTWGMPSALKITVSVDWSSTSATPISDIQAARRTARITRGKNLSRATMTTVALQYAAATTEFQTQVKNVFLAASLGGPTPSIPLQSDAVIKLLMEKIIGGVDGAFVIEIDDRHIETTNSAGLTTVSAIMPVNRVVLTDPADDGNSNIWDFAQGIVTESVISGFLPVTPLGPISGGRGPIGYVTATDLAANPPGIVHWAVDRGFPRRHQLQCSACLTVGSFSDTVSTTLPLP